VRVTHTHDLAVCRARRSTRHVIRSIWRVIRRSRRGERDHPSGRIHPRVNGERFCIPNDVLIVAQIIDAIDEAIRLRDKVLLILSEGAIASDWVEGEGLSTKSAHAMRSFLFPVRIDNAVMQTSEAWARLLRGQRNIGDFTRWKEHDSYHESFERLMRDLRVEKPGQ